MSRCSMSGSSSRPAFPAEDHLTTYTPRYSSSTRIKLMEMEQPWERADVHVRFPSPDSMEVTTRNVAVFNVRLEQPAGISRGGSSDDVHAAVLELHPDQTHGDGTAVGAGGRARAFPVTGFDGGDHAKCRGVQCQAR